MRKCKLIFVCICLCLIFCNINVDAGLSYNGSEYVSYEEAQKEYAAGVIAQQPAMFVHYYVDSVDDEVIEKKIYDFVSVDIPDDDVGTSLVAMGDSAECNISHRTVSYATYKSGDKTYIDAHYFTKYKVSKDNRRKAIREADKVVKQIRAMSGLSKGEQLLAAYKYVANNCAYDSSHLDDNSIYVVTGPMLRGKAVCQGYADAFYIMCRKLGIPCRIILGDAGNKYEDRDDWIAHAWNIVELDGKWYYVDPTWASDSILDSFDLYHTNFFLRGTDGEFSNYHEPYEEYLEDDFVNSHIMAKSDYEYPSQSLSACLWIYNFK